MEEKLQIAALESFEKLPDSGQQGKIFYLKEIILAALSAVICGADSYVKFAKFSKAKIDFLRNLQPLISYNPFYLPLSLLLLQSF